MAVSNSMVPPPQPLEIYSTQAAEKWRKFKRAWSNYSLATQLNEKAETVKVATLLTVVGEEVCKVFSALKAWANEDDKSN